MFYSFFTAALSNSPYFYYNINVKKVWVLSAIFLCLHAGFAPVPGAAQSLGAQGDSAIAEKYLLWAEEAIAGGQWPQARVALERAADFASVSSDIAYLTALARFRARESGGMVLQSLDQAIQTGSWSHYSEAEARLVQADQLIIMRRYTEALDSLAASISGGGYNAEAALLRLAAFKGLNRNADFHMTMRDTLERYPRDTRHLHILFDYALENRLAENDPLVEIAFRRLPFLLNTDPDLAWKAAMLTGEDDEARRLAGAYRSGLWAAASRGKFVPNPASIVPALNCGLMLDEDAVDELFSDTGNPVWDKSLLVKVWELLRSEEGRNLFAARLGSFTGVLTEDEDGDRYADSRAAYRQGVLQEYYYDADQDGLDEMFIIFDSDRPTSNMLGSQAGSPKWALITPLSAAPQIQIFWESYPFVQRVVQGDETWLFGPGEFRYSPIDFDEIGASRSTAGILFPRRNPGSRELTRRMLASAAVNAYRPGVEFEGSIERVHLQKGVPIRSETILNQQVVAVTEFENGSPIVQRLDLDMDGTMETIRRFRRISASEAQSQSHAPDYRPFIRSSESSRNGSEAFSSAQMYRSDNSIVYIWDFDGDGIREYYMVSVKEE